MSNEVSNVVPLDADLKMIEQGRQLARRLQPEEVTELLRVQLPSAIDYSKYVTYIRNQDGRGGCGTMASLAILDILKEKDRPFTPDASYRFAEYVYNDKGINQLEVLKQYGCCSEASLPTNYDITPLPNPSTGHFNEAMLYRIKNYSDPIHQFSVEDLKRLLIAYGPLFAVGDTPGSPPHGHVFAIIGYDDNAMAGTGAFKIVNSYGDRWGDNGFMSMPYTNITNPPSNQTYPRVDWIRWVENSLTPPFAQPFTARVKVHHEERRNYLTIKIGVEGQQPFVVWDRPCQTVMADNSLNLTLDVPLPGYASQFWPPNEGHQWYVEIIDSSPATAVATVGTVEEITLVQRVTAPNGRCIPYLFRPSAREFPIQRGGTVQIYVPSKKRYVLTLGVDHSQITGGSQVVFRGELFLQVGLSNTWNPRIALANQSVKIFRMRYDPIEQDIPEEMIGVATTGPDGNFALQYSPMETSTYQAVVTKPDYTTMATSNFAEVKVA